MHRFEIFAFAMYRDLVTRIMGSLKATGNEAIRQIVYDFLLMFNSNYGYILHRVWHYLISKSTATLKSGPVVTRSSKLIPFDRHIAYGFSLASYSNFVNKNTPFSIYSHLKSNVIL